MAITMKNRERVAIVGSRSLESPEDKAMVYAIVRSLKAGTVVVSGGAEGVDKWAEQHARDLGLVTVVVIPPWQALGKSAGVIRNGIIAQIADRCIALHDGKSHGTANTIGHFEKLKKPIKVLKITPKMTSDQRTKLLASL